MSSFIKLDSRRVLAVVRTKISEVHDRRHAIHADLVKRALERNNRWYARWFGIGRVSREEASVNASNDWEYLSYGHETLRLCHQLTGMIEECPYIILSSDDVQLLGLNKIP